MGGASPPVSESAAATATPDPWREFLQALVCEVPAGGPQCVKGDLTHFTRDGKLENTWVANVPSGCVERRSLAFRHPAQRYALVQALC